MRLDTRYRIRVTGRVVWAGFDGLDMVDRQEIVRDILEAALGDEATEVGIIFTYTPHELKVMQKA